MSNYESAREIERLKARVEELEWELDSLRDAVGAEVAAIMDFYDLTHGEARMIRALAHAGGAPLSRAVLMEAMQKDFDNLRSVDSHVKRIRNKAGARLPIDSLYGLGYRLLPDKVAEVKSVMAGGTKPKAQRVHVYVRGQLAAS